MAFSNAPESIANDTFVHSDMASVHGLRPSLNFVSVDTLRLPM